MVTFNSGGMEMAQTTEERRVARAAANDKYKKMHTKQVNVRFFMNNNDDVSLFEHAKSQDNLAAYIKRLIREDMERSQ